MNVIYEDKYILAVHKSAGVPTQTARVSQEDVVSLAGKYTGSSYIGLINRLDQPVEGLVLMALDKKTAASLSRQLTAGKIAKSYLAGVMMAEGLPETGTLTDHLLHDKKANISKIVPEEVPGAQRAVLDYRIIREAGITDAGSFALPSEAVGDGNADRSVRAVFALAEIDLHTGRHHQIRVQMAHAGMPLLGDRKYAPEYVQSVSKVLKISEIALCACGLTFTHPVSNDIINLRVEPQGKWYSFF